MAKEFYKQPKICAITLDVEQALLEVCQIGGGYWGTGNQCIGGAPMTECPISVRGVRNAGVGVQTETAPA